VDERKGGLEKGYLMGGAKRKRKKQKNYKDHKDRAGKMCRLFCFLGGEMQTLQTYKGMKKKSKK